VFTTVASRILQVLPMISTTDVSMGSAVPRIGVVKIEVTFETPNGSVHFR
jgi:hypothetical protein